MYYNMYLKHFFLRSDIYTYIISYDNYYINMAYNIIFLDLNITKDLKFSLFTQIFFEIITANFNDIVKKY